MEDSQRTTLFERMVTIRLFEERLLELFSTGSLFGTTHTCIGQEAIAVAAIDHLRDDDVIVSNHRCHGHYLARFDDPKGLLSEIMGRVGGICEGRGGSQHLCRDNFYSNGVQGGFVPIAAGMALAEKRRKSGSIVVCFIGDGTLGQGVVYETLNMVSLYELPLLIVVENNRYAQTTPVEHSFAGSFVGRFEAFGINADEVETNDIFELHERFGATVERVRGNQPAAEIIHTYRLKAHSKGDDVRDTAEIRSWEKRDPLLLAREQLGSDVATAISERVSKRLASIEAEVSALPLATLDSSTTTRGADAVRGIA